MKNDITGTILFILHTSQDTKSRKKFL